MSLDWHVDRIKNFKELAWIPNDDGETFHLNPVTDALIWMTMSVGINRITEKNWPVCHGRVAAVEGVFGSWLFDNLKPRYITAEDVEAHIGLGTNAMNMTAAAFEKGLSEKRTRRVKC